MPAVTRPCLHDGRLKPRLTRNGATWNNCSEFFRSYHALMTAAFPLFFFKLTGVNRGDNTVHVPSGGNVWLTMNESDNSPASQVQYEAFYGNGKLSRVIHHTLSHWKKTDI